MSGAALPVPADADSFDAAMAAYPDDDAGDALPVGPAGGAPDPAEAAPVAAKVDTPADDDEDWLELPPEADGGEPIRHKVSEVWEGFQRAKDLEAELAKARTAQPMPADVQEQLQATMQERGRYANALRQFALMNQPKAPDLELLNEASASFNPTAYYKGVQAYNEGLQKQQQVAAELQRIHQLQAEQAEQLQEANFARERAKLLEVWPEMKDGATAQVVRSDLEKFYGIDGATLAEVIDSRFYAVAKDALAWRATQAKQAEAVKVVRAKPKLIHGGARTTSNNGKGPNSEAMAHLRKTGSIEAAMALLPD